ncbi:MAG: hypothetical protein K0S44_1183 [Bacteroidetes bacterium]|jgi:hypothetical protein|nr:hypothetical protein [Bacteroidota bacterium]
MNKSILTNKHLIMKGLLSNKERLKFLLIFFLSIGTMHSYAQLTANAGTNTSICLGSSLTIGGSPSATGGSPPYTYSWSPSVGLSSTTTANPSASPTSTTTYTLIVTDAVSNVTSASIIVNVNPIPNVTATPSAQTICSNSSSGISLSSNVGGASFSWTVSQSGVTGATPSSNAAIVQFLTNTGSTPGTATYTITPSANGCTGSPITTVITVNPAPVITSSGTATICSGGTVSLPFTSNIPATYTWSATDNANTTGESTTTQTTSTLNNTITSIAPSTTNVSYTVQPTSLNGCYGNFYPITVTVNSVPVINATPASSTICGGTTTNITLSSSLGGTSYSWTATQSGVSGASSGGTSIISQTLNTTGGVTGTATYSATGTSAGCVSNPISITVTVNPTPSVGVNSTTICAGGSANLTCTAIPSGGTYLWSPGGSTSSSINVSPSSTTGYSCTYTKSGCQQTGFGTVTVNNPPVASFSYLGTPFCQGAGNPSPTFSGGGTAGTFSSTAGLVIINTSTGQIDLAASTPGTYVVTNTIPASGGCAAVSANSTITITAPSNATFNYPSSVFCQNAPDPSPTLAGGASAGTFTSSPAGMVINSSTGVINLGITSPGTYTVTNTIAAGGGCPAGSATFNVTVNGLPSVTTSNNGPLCPGASLGLSANSIAGGTYSWTGPSGFSSTLQNPFISNVTSANAGVYTLTVTANGCSNTSTTNVIVNSLMTLTSTSANVSCNGVCDAIATVNAAGGSGPYLYQWSDVATQTTQTATGLCASTYYVIVTDINGCTASDTLTISEPSLLNANPTTTNANCYGACNGTAFTSPTGGTASYTYSWSPGGQTTSSISSLCAGIYTVTVTDANGCNTTQNVIVTEPGPLTLSTGSNQMICAGDTATLTGTVSGGVLPYSFSWSNGGTSSSISVAPVVTSSYTLNVTDNIGCISIPSTVTVIVSPLADITGQVSYSGGSLSSGMNTAVLYPTTSFDTLMITTVDASGNYTFTSVAQGDYLIKIFADTTAYPSLIPTYYGDAFLWDSASVITHACAATIANVMMNESASLIGPGVISGVVEEGNGFDRIPGDPIPGVDIKLGRNPGGQLVTNTQTGASGGYTFTGIPVNLPGEYYTIYVDIPGIDRDSTHSVVVTSTSTTFPGMDYVADSTDVYPVQLSVGITKLKIETAFTVYPNPTKGNIVIDYNLTNNSNVCLGVYNPLGVLIAEPVNTKQASGNYKQTITLEDHKLDAGIYFIILVKDGKSSLQRLVITK